MTGAGRARTGAAAPPVRLADTVAEAARKVLSVHLERLRLHEAGARSGAEPEPLHAMRVASRRLRSALAHFEDGLPRRTADRLRGEVRWLGRLLGAVRDLDVHLLRLAEARAGLPEDLHGALRGLESHLERERARCRRDLNAGLDSERYAELAAGLERLATGAAGTAGAATETIARIGPRLVRRRLRRFLKAGAAVASRPSPEALHRLRIRAKRLRYLLEFLREPAGKEGRRLTQALIRLQDRLGAHQDALVAADRVSAYLRRRHEAPNAEGVWALELLVGRDHRHAEKIRADFPRVWRGFDSPESLDLHRALLRRLARGPRARRGTLPGRSAPSAPG